VPNMLLVMTLTKRQRLEQKMVRRSRSWPSLFWLSPA
jgi:hypothetical protein